MPNFDYGDEQGRIVNRVVKYGNGKYRQEHLDDDGNWISGKGDSSYPFHLSDVLEAIDQGHPIWIMEGEGDVETAYLNGLVATCNSGGAGKWTDEQSKWLVAGEPIFICFDDDGPGRRHALKVEASLRRVGISDIRFRKARSGNDFTDHINAGHEVSELIKIKRPVLKNGDVTEEKFVVDNEEDNTPVAAFQLALIRLKKVTPEYGKPGQYNAICPAHSDTRPSLSIRAGGPDDEVAVMVHCHANQCDPADIARALDISPIEFTRIPTREKGTQEYEDERAVMRKRANRYADMVLAVEGLGEIAKFGDKSDTFEQELAIPLEPTKWFVDRWFRYSSSALLISDYKAGKSRLVMNMALALTNEEPFLGVYQTSMPDSGRIWYGNFDMTEEEFRTYIADYDWKHPERMIVEHLAAGMFPIWIPSVFDDFVQYALRMNITCLVIDTLAMACQGFADESSNPEMSEYIALMKKLCRAAKIPHLLIVHHVGKSDKETGRGASSLGASVSTIITLLKEGDDFDSPRSLKAVGRGVGVAPVALAYSLETEMYTADLGQPQIRSGKYVVQNEDRRVVEARVAYLTNLVAWHARTGVWPNTRQATQNCMTGDGKTRAKRMKVCADLGLVTVGKRGTGAYMQVSELGLGYIKDHS